MKKDSMKREREAVDSEFEMALPSDYNRYAFIGKTFYFRNKDTLLTF